MRRPRPQPSIRTELGFEVLERRWVLDGGLLGGLIPSPAPALIHLLTPPETQPSPPSPAADPASAPAAAESAAADPAAADSTPQAAASPLGGSLVGGVLGIAGDVLNDAPPALAVVVDGGADVVSQTTSAIDELVDQVLASLTPAESAPASPGSLVEHAVGSATDEIFNVGRLAESLLAVSRTELVGGQEAPIAEGGPIAAIDSIVSFFEMDEGWLPAVPASPIAPLTTGILDAVPPIADDVRAILESIGGIPQPVGGLVETANETFVQPIAGVALLPGLPFADASEPAPIAQVETLSQAPASVLGGLSESLGNLFAPIPSLPVVAPVLEAVHPALEHLAVPLVGETGAMVGEALNSVAPLGAAAEALAPTIALVAPTPAAEPDPAGPNEGTNPVESFLEPIRSLLPSIPEIIVGKPQQPTDRLDPVGSVGQVSEGDAAAQIAERAIAAQGGWVAVETSEGPAAQPLNAVAVSLNGAAPGIFFNEGYRPQLHLDGVGSPIVVDQEDHRLEAVAVGSASVARGRAPILPTADDRQTLEAAEAAPSSEEQPSDDHEVAAKPKPKSDALAKKARKTQAGPEDLLADWAAGECSDDIGDAAEAEIELPAELAQNEEAGDAEAALAIAPVAAGLIASLGGGAAIRRVRLRQRIRALLARFFGASAPADGDAAGGTQPLDPSQLPGTQALSPDQLPGA